MLYRVIVTGDLSPRYAASLQGVTVETAGDTTTLSAKLASAADLDELLARLADLGIEVVSLSQDRGPD